MLRPIHKNTVKAMLRKGQTFRGYIAPSKVNSFHIRGGWHIGMSVEFTSIEEMEKCLPEFAYYNCNAELGHTIRFWVES